MTDIILILIAVIPAVALMIYIYKKDKVEKEPIGLLVALVIGGAISIIPGVILEILFEDVFLAFLSSTSLIYIIIENFIGVALIEEGVKLAATKLVSWKNKAFNYTFDGVVYAVFVSLGFALFENLEYVLMEETFADSLSVGFWRAILSVPLHCFCGVFMGVYYAQAKKQSLLGNESKKKHYLLMALLVPSALHGFYDFCLSVDSLLIEAIFVVFVIAMYISSFRLIRKESKDDQLQPTCSSANTGSSASSTYTNQQYSSQDSSIFGCAAAGGLQNSQQQSWVCKSCGTANTGNFCTHCGTKRNAL
jgi:protease PrsW